MPALTKKPGKTLVRQNNLSAGEVHISKLNIDLKQEVNEYLCINNSKQMTQIDFKKNFE